jgi:transcription elongation factor GreA
MSIPITKGGYERIIEEARHLKKVERPAIIAKIAEARSHGDLSENAEYHAAREKQSFIEGRIEYLDGVIADAEVIDITKFKNEKEKVLFGATVKLLDNDTDEEVVYTLVGEVESDTEHGKISIASPKGRALIGKTLGDDVVVQTPAGAREYEILEVKYV